MNLTCQQYCLEVIDLSEKLIKLAHKSHLECDEDRCMVLSGIVLDSASRVRTEAEKRLKNLKGEFDRNVSRGNTG